jgi:membrane protease subunit HflK
MVWDDSDSKSKKSAGHDEGGGGFKPPEFKMPKINFPKPNVSIYLIILVPVLMWFIMGGYYIVHPEEEGVVVRFGVINRTTKSGFHLKFPPPIEKVYMPKVTEVMRDEIGFRIQSSEPPAKYRDMPEESLMLTGDENIIDLDVVVQYRIVDPLSYLFKVVEPQITLHAAAEAAIREVIGKHSIDEALTEGKADIQGEIKELLQRIITKYETGLTILAVQLQDVHPPKQVIGAFKDVASAREDKNRLINESEGYRNAIIPEARGEAAQLIKGAEGYKEEKIARAKGDADRFLAVLEEYKKAKNITRKRLYIETLEEVFPNLTKYVLEDSKGVLPFLPLNNMQQPIIAK